MRGGSESYAICKQSIEPWSEHVKCKKCSKRVCKKDYNSKDKA